MPTLSDPSLEVDDLSSREIRSRSAASVRPLATPAPRPEPLSVDLPHPEISVIIPTRHRPLLVMRAVQSALDQSFRDLEVIVVLDGPDVETELLLKGLGDNRLHLLCLRRNVGGAEARNIGVRYSRGKWIALLDDDDEWLPGKLALQWKAGESISSACVLVASKFIERTEFVDRQLPGRLPAAREKFSDYLFVRRGWQSGEGFLQTSTWFVSRQLMVQVPFTRGLKRCQDLDWLLHATALPETQVAVLPVVLAIFHHDELRERVSRTADWKFLYKWAAANRSYFTSGAFSFFLATFCVPSAAKQREGAHTFLFLLRECLFDGYPTLKCLILFLVCWFMPEGRRRTVRAAVSEAEAALGLHQLSAVVRSAPGDGI